MAGDETDLKSEYDLPVRLRPENIELMSDVEVRKAASADGAGNLPESDAEQPSDTERRLINEFQDTARDLELAAESILRRAVAKIAELTPDTIIPEQRMALIKSKQSAEIAKAGGALISAKKAERRRARDLRWFKETHELNREARYDDDALPKTAFFIIALIAVEAIISSQLFSNQGLPGGVIGAVLFAVVVSFINAFALGYVLIGMIGMRLIGHYQAERRAAGWAALSTGVVLAFVFNIIIASLRGASDLSGVLQAAVSVFTRTPLSALNAPTIGIFIIGCVVCLLGALKGRSGLYDPYWDFAEYDRAHRVARGEEEKAEDMIREVALDILEREGTSRLDAELREGEAGRVEADAASNAALTSLRQARAASERLKSEADRKLRLYRKVNRRTRDGDRPVPAYFSDYSLPPITEINGAPIRDALKAQHQRLEANADAARKLREHIATHAMETEALVGKEVQRAREAASGEDAGAPYPKPVTNGHDIEKRPEASPPIRRPRSDGGAAPEEAPAE